ncbi:MAG: hypothetical protein AB1938_26770 [Myxococcota bacterium]
MRPFAAALVLALVIVGAPLWGGARFFYRDVSRQYEPLAHQLSQAWGRGDAPLWNASTQGGVPLLANLHAGALAPHALLTATAPFHLGYAWAVALALTILGAGMFRLLRDFVGPRESAVGAAAVVLSGVMLGATSYLPFLAGLSLVPWQARLCRVERSRLVVPGLALLFAAQIFEGDPSTAVMGGLASLALTPRAALRVGASAGLGALVAMVQLGPAWDLFAVSSRAAGSAEAQLAWSLHPLRLVELVVRLPWGQLLQEPYFTRYELAAGPDAQPFLLDHGWGTVAVLLLPLGLVGVTRCVGRDWG